MNHILPKQIGDYNKNQILSILRESGPLPRVELSRLLGISQTAVTRNTAKLLQHGIIWERGADYANVGRKPILIELCRDFCYVAGADVVGGTLKVVLANLMGEIVRYSEEPLNVQAGASAVLGRLIAVLQDTIAESGVPRGKIWTVVIGTPGIFDAATGKSRWFTHFADGWDAVDIQAVVRDALSIETLVENDVNLDVIGESWKGAGKDYEDILYVKLGQGLAARLVIQNKLVRGAHHMAGEIGYMSTGPHQKGASNYEDILCNEALAKMYADAGGTQNATTIPELCTLADNGDAAALTVTGHLFEQFAVVLQNSAVMFDPQAVILGGDACCFGTKEMATLERHVKRLMPLEQRFMISKLNKKAGVYGAIKVGLDRVEERIVDVW